MKYLLDTSVLVAGLIRSHPDHARAAPWLKRMKGAERSVTVHALAETWATLTAMPLDPRIAGDQATAMIGRVSSGLRVFPLGRAIYSSAMRRCVSHGLRSGALYDALHLIAAEKAKVDDLLTFNVADFSRMAPQVGVRAPD